MFYSHEVLTSRKHGVATVWLVATLGSKSKMRKVTRKDILDVNVPKACETIIAPQAPMALRLQSSLLYGISRVYSQQCSYILTDAQNAQTNMRAAIRAIKSVELDLEVAQARPEQLLLEDDPTFLPDFALAPLDFDLSNLEAPSPRSEKLRSSRSGSRSSISLEEQLPAGPVGGLELPTSDSIGGDLGGFVVPGDEGPGVKVPDAGALIAEDDGFLPEADFGFDADGNLLEFTGTDQPHHSTPGTAPRLGLGSDTAASARVRQDHEGGQLPGEDVGDRMNINIPLGDDLEQLPEGEAFPSAHDVPTSPSGRPLTEGDVVETVSSEQAPMKRKRKARVIALDQSMELRNTDLSNWMKNYPANMAEASMHKFEIRTKAQARKNAEHWVLGGLGGISGIIGNTTLSGPLDMFRGDALLRALGIATKTSVAGQKRPRESVEEEQTEEERRTRQRSDEDDVARRLDEDSGFVNIDDIEPELPREGQQDMTEHLSTGMPWNITASARGSSVARSVRTALGLGSMGAAAPTSAGGPSSVAGPAGSLGRRGSRLVSASPLLGRGRAGTLEPLRSLEAEEGAALGDEGVSLNDEEEFELYGTAAGVDTQTANESQFLNTSLLQEENNVRVWMYNALKEKMGVPAGDEEDVPESDAVPEGLFESEILFEELVPLEGNTRIVACQAFMHVLSLTTKGFITAMQEEPFADIRLALVPVQG
ncbi:uncharacterized protein K452DRAFT_303302 [Aplosporella prunicola CBS 121167]|uniref:Rad21/Rec8-like protein N-terminal domain-containing protein n=1 Tax=Aplosporella prunicola CBS 121167 TaxID=1176127 RepID=A0A6A6AXQ8_9PEZI|nr:uncharacterized protein K452DRAFT_303302 [Aplosporella prunicola CBS 121167]KAF2135765.1 hypothetical protein K452DRAFT_303302 [Aplosporella prunicola CBS 121167]